jgi:bifunctional oligoribonuclease and PAP phosphatase NrnA
VNVAEIAQKFGGGGHECAGGFSTEGPVKEAATRVLAELRQHLPQNRT